MSWPLVKDLAHTGPMDRPDGRLNAWILAYVGETVWSAPGAPLPGAELPPAARRARLLREPAAPGRARRAAAEARRPGARLQRRAPRRPPPLRPRRAAPRRAGSRATGSRRSWPARTSPPGPHRWTRLSHLHAQVTVFLPFALLALDRFWERRSLRRALVVGLALALQGLASIYLGAITAAALAVATAVALLGGAHGRASSGGWPRASCSRALILWPVARPYLRMRAFQGQEFTLETVSTYAASLPSYAASGVALWGPLTQRLLDPATIRDTLFPGLVVLALGIAGPRLGAAPLSGGRRRRLGRGDRLLARARHRALPLPARARRAGARRARPLALRAHPHARPLRARRARLVGPAAAVVLAALGLMMVESANLPLRLERYDGPLAGVAVARRPARARSSSCPSPRTTRWSCSTASPTAGRS